MADLPFDRHLGVQDTDRAIKAYAEIEIPQACATASRCSCVWSARCSRVRSCRL